MVNNKISEERQDLLKKYHATRSLYFNAESVVSRKFTKIGKGTSQTNPTDKELSEVEEARKALKQIEDIICEFNKKYD